MFMPRCTHPLPLLHPHDKLRVIVVPCGQCIACRIRKASGWALRALMEYHANNRCGVFLTLTYDDEHLPQDGELSKRELQLFFKRFRKTVGSIRYLAAGEYGEQTLRPHYHILIFGIDDTHTVFNFFKPVPNGRVGRLSDWPQGIVHVGYISDRSCMYVAKYAIKRSGALAQFKQQPFQLMSRRPGLGASYIMSHAEDVRTGRDKCVRYIGEHFPSLPNFVKDKINAFDMLSNHDLTAERIQRNHEIDVQLADARVYLDLLSRLPAGELPERYRARLNIQRERDIAGFVRSSSTHE